MDQTRQYVYKKLSDLLGMKIENENQYQLALQGASKETVEANMIDSAYYPLTKEYNDKKLPPKQVKFILSATPSISSLEELAQKLQFQYQYLPEFLKQKKIDLQ